MGWHADAGADNILLRTFAAATYFSRWRPAVVLLTATALSFTPGRALLNTGTSKEE
jgi:hypothetical protein